MSSITQLTPSLRHSINQRKQAYREKKLLEFAMQESIANMEEFQFMLFRDTELMGIESFEILSTNDQQPVCYAHN